MAESEYSHRRETPRTAPSIPLERRSGRASPGPRPAACSLSAIRFLGEPSARPRPAQSAVVPQSRSSPGRGDCAGTESANLTTYALEESTSGRGCSRAGRRWNVLSRADGRVMSTRILGRRNWKGIGIGIGIARHEEIAHHEWKRRRYPQESRRVTVVEPPCRSGSPPFGPELGPAGVGRMAAGGWAWPRRTHRTPSSPSSSAPAIAPS